MSEPRTDRTPPGPTEASVRAAVVEWFHDAWDANVSLIEWRERLVDSGWAVPSWSPDWFGRGLPAWADRVAHGAIRHAGGVATPLGGGFGLAAPTMYDHASDELKSRFLRDTLTGAVTWCQLFSEPGAGSDLAGLQCTAVRDGDEWVVNGQKVWNTLAHIADFGMLVTRTDPEAPKHKGMTYFALDMASEGVEVRPLRQITGEAEFNEVYMTDVRVPDAHRVGAVGEGWRASLTTLMNERNAIGGGGGGAPKRGAAANDAVEVWQQMDESRQDAATKDRLMQFWVEAEVGRLTNMRASQNAKSGNPGPEMSIAKLAFSELNKGLYEFCMDLMGADALIEYDYTFRRPEQSVASGGAHGLRYAFLRVRANSIEGGTSEIMRNILGEQVLGLPGEPRVDKVVPWNEVPRN